jgi:hypothetical protein
VVEAAEVEAAVVGVEAVAVVAVAVMAVAVVAVAVVAVAVVAVAVVAVVQGCWQHRGAIHCQTGERLHQTLPGSVGKELCRSCHQFPPPPHPYTFHNTKSMYCNVMYFI